MKKQGFRDIFWMGHNLAYFEVPWGIFSRWALGNTAAEERTNGRRAEEHQRGGGPLFFIPHVRPSVALSRCRQARRARNACEGVEEEGGAPLCQFARNFPTCSMLYCTVCSSESWKIFEPQCLPYQWSEEALFSTLYWFTYCQTNPKVFPKNLENCGGYINLNWARSKLLEPYRINWKF